ncbi:NERD domain-containing protein [Clostridium pasteurianum DSM 525 = ATCC 6013]|uniref:NERD domain protein n=1 Tax=Clostridium pasteurianum DSM 525 = ATCC 6013 TaxID=1262449 RepID=A0A0H3J9S7_CLOPA|nr:nuclease-related domain-containing protein [Clostridium pasteurianum]AJA48938.1 NERD domain-containing protein [Clostridium pasteurianum DSM 525 = ATCC 6013]AJA52926.1 NERD domain-containing protein [Clostridium pasteurianum DSM 525 = ATCC 6013]AOZ76147.1 nuclease [Clostridium pasteurianum DSM 525 = ATCC 6013]AOZ79943.1 nuclease [Clostridium pasteurianum]ELP60234.1 NERD domain-containing protein [Clostridium pasteurianum DSM 525 = ATCC 6013]
MAIIKSKETSLNIKWIKNLIFQIVAFLTCIASVYAYVYYKNIYISLIIFVVAFIGIIHFHNRSKIYKYGIQGEKAVSKLLCNLSNKYIVYNDIIIGGKEKGAQIDHLVLSTYGIFCIETKNMTGTIIGGEEDSEWIQIKIGKGGTKYEKRFYNPCRQSRGHVNAIKNFFRHSDFKVMPIYSIVVFNNNKYINLKVQGGSTTVLKSENLIQFIESKREVLITSDKLKGIGKFIDKGRW